MRPAVVAHEVRGGVGDDDLDACHIYLAFLQRVENVALQRRWSLCGIWPRL